MGAHSGNGPPCPFQRGPGRWSGPGGRGTPIADFAGSSFCWASLTFREEVAISREPVSAGSFCRGVIRSFVRSSFKRAFTAKAKGQPDHTTMTKKRFAPVLAPVTVRPLSVRPDANQRHRLTAADMRCLSLQHRTAPAQPAPRRHTIFHSPCGPESAGPPGSVGCHSPGHQCRTARRGSGCRKLAGLPLHHMELRLR